MRSVVNGQTLGQGRETKCMIFNKKNQQLKKKLNQKNTKKKRKTEEHFLKKLCKCECVGVWVGKNTKINIQHNQK